MHSLEGFKRDVVAHLPGLLALFDGASVDITRIEQF